MARPASLSLDLDNQWSYLKTAGFPQWSELPSYFDVVVPRFLEFLRARDLRITVFVVGQDAALEGHRRPLAAVADAGHEIGNHSYRHEPWLHLYSAAEIEEELTQAEECIRLATGQRPRGFRGPGYSLSDDTLRVLVRRNYLYDASTLPTFIGPLARAYYFLRSPLGRKDREKRRALFGSFRDGLRSVRPYCWDVDGSSLLEIPVTTLPLLRLPFHASYVLYLASFSPRLGLLYFRMALELCRLSGIGPSFLLHPLDFLDAGDVPSLAFFPVMRLPWATKLDLLDRMLGMLRDRFDVLPMREHAQRALAEGVPHVKLPRPPGRGRAHADVG